jgi:hypothetical protein
MGRRTTKKDKDCDQNAVPMGVAWYSRKQWDRLLEIAEDRNNIEDTYEEWEANAEVGFRRLSRPGFVPQKIDIDVEELICWCKLKKRPVDGAARSIFAAEKLREQIKANQ